MIRLKNVSKFYYSKDVISSGFTKVNLELKMGEFVVITGESGSGKSTLLNVISGLDTYEEGEMYINGEETSHYAEKDFEEYRKKYIGNIFQNFNLVNSYTVYQNIELVMLLNGYSKKQAKQRILDIIRQVGLQKFKNTKCSKLSGGQKQRVAIARALAKDSPIIVADEPTGNLDSESSTGIIKLLSEIAKNKLVVIVTHNYEQVEQYATRKITMHDGQILEDRVLKKTQPVQDTHQKSYGNISVFNEIRLGLRNTFNVIPKFILLLVVFLLMISAVIAEYSTVKKQQYETGKMGYNSFFLDTSDKRIVIKKNDGSAFTDTDYAAINALSNIDYIVKDDILIDSYIGVFDETYYYSGSVFGISLMDGNVDVGRMPEAENEIVIAGAKYDYYLGENPNEVLNKEYQVQDNYSGTTLDGKVTIVGIKYIETNNMYNYINRFYVSDSLLEQIRENTHVSYSTSKVVLAGITLTSQPYSQINRLVPSDKVPKGKIVASDDYRYSYRASKNKTVSVSISNLYFEDSIDVTVSNFYTKKNLSALTGFADFDKYSGSIFMNTEDYNALFDKGNFQSSVYLKDAKDAAQALEALNALDLNALYVKDTLVQFDSTGFKILNILRVMLMFIFALALFFICYFIIKIILKSRNVYFSTIRILGASKNVSKSLLNIELLTVFTIAVLAVGTFIVLVMTDTLNITYVKDLLEYLHTYDYIVLYAVVLLMTLLITAKFSKSLFKKSAMTTYRQEV